MHRHLLVLSLSLAVARALYLNEVQLWGTEKSYHVSTAATVIPEWKFQMPPLVEQAARGARWFELYPHRSGDEYDVFNMATYDDATNCATVRLCLAPLLNWSKAHPNHQAIFVSFVFGAFYDWAHFADHVKSVWGAAYWDPVSFLQMQTTVRRAIAAHGWPSVDSLRGTAIFLVNFDAIQSTLAARSAPVLSGYPFFVLEEVVKSSMEIADLDDNTLVAYVNQKRFDSMDAYGKKVAELVQSRQVLVRAAVDNFLPVGGVMNQSAQVATYLQLFDVDGNGTVTRAELLAFAASTPFQLGINVTDAMNAATRLCGVGDTINSSQLVCINDLGNTLGQPLLQRQYYQSEVDAFTVAALHSGAHVIATIYADAVAGLNYSFSWPAPTPVRCNPILTASCSVCNSSAIEATALSTSCSATPGPAPVSQQPTPPSPTAASSARRLWPAVALSLAFLLAPAIL